MNIKRPLMPGFLKRAEQKLLLNKPGIWSTRAHLVVYYGVLFLLVLTILCFLEPNDPRSYSTTEGWVSFVSVIGGIGLIVWMIYLLRFNVFKKYGTIHPLHALVTFLLYFISTGIIVSFSYVHPVVETVRASMAYGDKEVVDDINDINTKIYQLEYNQLQDTWDHDTVELVKNDTTAVSATDYDSDTVAAEMPVVVHGNNYYQEDSAAFSDKIEAADSLVKLKDSIYLVYKTPKLTFLSPYLYDADVKEHLLTDFELYRKVYGHPPTAARREIIKRQLDVLLKKYEYPKYTGYPLLEIEKDDTPRDIIQKKYRLNNIDNSISHVFRKKYRLIGDHLEVYLRVFYYFTLGITLLIFIFRHTTVRTFFLSILTGVVITIITALIAAFMRADAIHILGCLIAYTLLFFFVSLTVFRAKKRNAIAGIATNLFVFVVKLLPLFIVVWYYEYNQNQFYIQTQNYIEPFEFEKYAAYAEVGGFVLLLMLISTYISKIYRRWYSLPEN